MGQRLVIDINKEGETIANVYYHWDGYTQSSFERIADLRDMIFARDHEISYFMRSDIKDLLHDNVPGPRLFNAKALAGTDDVIERLIIGLQATGGGFGADTLEKHRADIQKLYPNLVINDKADRNNGLIEIFPDGVDLNRRYGEEFATIDLDDNTAEDHVFFATESRQDLLDEYDLADGNVKGVKKGSHDGILPSDEDIPLITDDFDNIPLDKIEEFYKMLEDKTNAVKGCYLGRIFRTPDGEYVTWIE